MVLKFSREVTFGVFALGAIALFIVGMNYLKGSRLFGSPFRLYAEYADVQGLIKGNPIMINGLKVGKVGALELNMQRGVATATLEFDQSLQIPDNSKAIIYSADLLGSKAIEIVIDSTVSPIYFKDGDYIADSLDAGLFAKATEVIQNEGAYVLLKLGELTTELNEIARYLRTALDDPRNRSAMSQILQEMQATAININQATARVDTIADNLNTMSLSASKIVSTVESRNSDIDGIIGNVRTTTDSLVAASDEIKQLMTDASSAVGSVENLVTKLDTTTGTLGMLFNDTQLYDSLTSTTENINSLLREVNANPQRFFDDIKIYLIERKPPKAPKKSRKERKAEAKLAAAMQDSLQNIGSEEKTRGDQ